MKKKIYFLLFFFAVIFSKLNGKSIFDLILFKKNDYFKISAKENEKKFFCEKSLFILRINLNEIIFKRIKLIREKSSFYLTNNFSNSQPISCHFRELNGWLIEFKYLYLSN